VCAFFKTFASYVPWLISRRVATDLHSITQPWIERSRGSFGIRVKSSHMLSKLNQHKVFKSPNLRRFSVLGEVSRYV